MKNIVKRQKTPVKDKGYMSIEASVIIPMVLVAVYVIITGLIIIFEMAVLYKDEVTSIYQIPLSDIRNDNVAGYLNGKNYGAVLEYGEASGAGNYMNHKAEISGELKYIRSFSVCSKKEMDVCVDRLRRWQLYDDIKEGAGD